MANPEEIGPAYQCATCLAWGPAEVCATCEAETSIVVGVDFGPGGDETVITVVDGDGKRVVVDSIASVDGVEFGLDAIIREDVARLAAAHLIPLQPYDSRDAVMRRVMRDVEDRLRRALWREGIRLNPRS